MESNGVKRDNTRHPALERDAELRSRRALEAVAQYLRDQGLEETLACLKAESAVQFDEESVQHGGLLLAALDHFDESEFGKLITPEALEAKRIDAMLGSPPEDSSAELVSRSHKVFEGLHTGNIICSRFSRASQHGHAPALVTAAADRVINVVDVADGKVRHQFKDAFKAAILSVDSNPVDPNLILATSMDATSAVLSRETNGVLQYFKDHKKFVTTGRWNPTGQLFATASHDFAVRLYAPVSESTHNWKCVKEWLFRAQVESVEWLSATKFIVSVREDNYLHVLDAEQLKEIGSFNMNANGDDHVSFTALHLQPNASGELVLASTDKDRVILFTTAGKQVRNFYGACNDGLSNPRSAWSANENYVYSTSQKNYAIISWDVRHQRVQGEMRGHTKNVRDLHHHPALPMLASAGYDKVVRLWSTSA